MSRTKRTHGGWYFGEFIGLMLKVLKKYWVFPTQPILSSQYVQRGLHLFHLVPKPQTSTQSSICPAESKTLSSLPHECDQPQTGVVPGVEWWTLVSAVTNWAHDCVNQSTRLPGGQRKTTKQTVPLNILDDKQRTSQGC